MSTLREGMDTSVYRTIASTCILSFLISIDVTIVNVALPTIQDALAVPTASLGWIVAGYSLAFATLMLSGGALSDRFGPARIFAGGLVIFGIGSVIDAVAHDFPLLLLGRIVQGVGAALCTPSALAVLRSSVPPKHLGRAVALWTFSASVAVSVGPLLTGALVEFLSWRSVFVLNVVVAALVMWLILPAVRDSRVPSTVAPRRWDAVGQALYAVSSGLFVGSLILMRDPVGVLQRPVLAVLLAVSASGLLAFFLHERRFADPVLPATLTRNRDFQIAVVIGGSITFVNFGLVYCLGLYYGGDHGFSPLESGALFLPMMTACGVSTTFVERFRRAIGNRMTIAAGIAANLVGAVLICARPDHAGWVAANAAFLGFGVGLAIPPLTANLLAAVDVRIAGVAGGALSSTRQFSIALGVAVLGLMVHGAGTSVEVDLRLISAVCAAVMLAALGTYLAASRRKTHTRIPQKNRTA